MQRSMCWILAFVASAVMPVLAHHSFAAEYDVDKPVTIKGTVTKFDFINPHTWVHVDGTDDKGKKGSWSAEMINPNALLRRGWTKQTLKPGLEITIEGSRARDGSNTVHSTLVRFQDGKVLYTTASGTANSPERGR